MYKEIIDPPDDIFPEEDESLDWLDDLAQEYAEDETAALHAYECKIYREPNRRYA